MIFEIDRHGYLLKTGSISVRLTDEICNLVLLQVILCLTQSMLSMQVWVE